MPDLLQGVSLALMTVFGLDDMWVCILDYLQTWWSQAR